MNKNNHTDFYDDDDDVMGINDSIDFTDDDAGHNDGTDNKNQKINDKNTRGQGALKCKKKRIFTPHIITSTSSL